MTARALSVLVDTALGVCNHTPMQPSLVKFHDTNFQPADVESITGMKPALIRDWRRRELLHERFDRGPFGFSTTSVAALLLLSRLADHGIGPKTLQGWIFAFADKLHAHAMNAESAWPTPEAWKAWRARAGHTERFLIIPEGQRALFVTDDLADAMKGSAAIATVIDLKALGTHLRTSADRPLSGVEWVYGGSDQ